MRALLIKEMDQTFIRGKGSKEALGIGIFDILFGEKPILGHGIPQNFWDIYPYDEYVRLMKKYFMQEKVIKFIDDHNIDLDQTDIEISYQIGAYKTEIVSFKFYSNNSLEGLGKLLLAWPKDQGESWKSQIGTERNRLYGQAGQVWDEFYIRPELQSMFNHPLRD